jgi:outer membrane protein OmpA-like peptidoglycan-associated protein
MNRPLLNSTFDNDVARVSGISTERTQLLFSLHLTLAVIASMNIVGVDKDGNEIPLQFKVEEFISTQLRPLLNYVFFMENSSELRPEYTQITSEEANKFRVEKLFNYETLSIYYQLMNIIGRRLVEHPKAKITLVGCNAAIRDEKGNLELSRKRAETIRDYFKKVWQISDNRIIIQARELPEKNSNMTTEDGIAENRRVEIQCSDWEILEPVLTIDTLRVTNPPVARFKPIINAESGIAGWHVESGSNGKKLKEFNGATNPPINLDCHIEKEKQRTLASLGALKYQLKATDAIGQTVMTTLDSIPVTQLTLAKKKEQHMADTVFSRYNLILFDFSKSNLNPNNQRIADYVRAHIVPNDIATINGYADRIGTPEYNLALSEARAKSTAIGTNLTHATIKGIGGTELLYDNDIPEGRFYCRTVTIFVATPTKH